MLSVAFCISKDYLSVGELALVRGQAQVQSLNELFWSDKTQEEKQKLLSQEIQKISQKHKDQVLRFSYSIPQEQVSCFSVSFPFKERFKILKSLPFEIEDRTPFQIDKIYFDGQITQIKDKSSAHVLCFLTPKENIDSVRDFLKPMKQPIHLLSCSASALSQVLQKWDSPLSKPQNLDSQTVYIYLGDQNSSCVFLYKEGFLNQVSTLNWSCAGFIEEMQKVYKLTKEKAYCEFFEKAFILQNVKGFTKEQVMFSNMAKKHIQPLIAEWNLQKISLETEHKTPITKWVIFGPGAMIKNLSVFLTEKLEQPVSKLQSCPALPRWDWRSQPLSAQAVGLALEGLKRLPYPGLNFLHGTKKETGFFSKKLQKTLMALFVFFSIFSVYAFTKKRETVKLLGQAQELFIDYAQKIAYLPKGQVSPSSVQNFLNNQEERRKVRQRIQKELAVDSPIHYLEKIIQKTGSAQNFGLRIDFLKISRKKLEIRGSVDPSQLKSFEEALQSLSRRPVKNQFMEADSPAPAPMKAPVEAPEDPIGDNKGQVFSYSLELKDF